MLALVFLSCFAVLVGLVAWFTKGLRRPSLITGRASRIQHLRVLAARHEVAAALIAMIDRDGAGDWPPRANHESLPKALLPYKSIYMELLPLLCTDTPSSVDSVNIERRKRYRETMSGLLRDRINLDVVVNILEEIQKDNWDTVSRDTLNAFYCCVAVCRHAYRWAVMPVVKVAQLEKEVDLPPELSVPWPYLQRYYGIFSDSGSHTSNVLMNFNPKGERMFSFSNSLSPTIQSAEEGFFRLLYDVDVMSFDILYDLVVAITSFKDANRQSCLGALQTINLNLRGLFTLFHRRMTEKNISRTVWLNFVQGFHAWSAGRMVNGEFIQFDGVSGNQILVFQALDALLGMETYHSSDALKRHMSATQRGFCEAVRYHSFRSELKGTEDQAMIAEFEALVTQLKRYRALHRGRVMPYLNNPAPERYYMTAGASVLSTDPNIRIDEALKPLEQKLINRSMQTL
ncbi:hypothetical protein F5Y10DRAFT_277653 [Nemania abortiva]|nr:hypothetical protein F5Y10DRAFT_277653 [Nemania abortiva]